MLDARALVQMFTDVLADTQMSQMRERYYRAQAWRKCVNLNLITRDFACLPVSKRLARASGGPKYTKTCATVAYTYYMYIISLIFHTKSAHINDMPSQDRSTVRLPANVYLSNKCECGLRCGWRIRMNLGQPKQYSQAYRHSELTLNARKQKPCGKAKHIWYTIYM